MALFKKKARIVFASIKTSKIFLWGPIGIVVLVISISIYIEAGTHLTPSSVSVRGYYRSNGTYVRPYNRRPPGGVAHDSPYETKRGICFFFIIIGTATVVVPTAIMITSIRDGVSQLTDIQPRK